MHVESFFERRRVIERHRYGQFGQGSRHPRTIGQSECGYAEPAFTSRLSECPW